MQGSASGNVINFSFILKYPQRNAFGYLSYGGEKHIHIPLHNLVLDVIWNSKSPQLLPFVIKCEFCLSSFFSRECGFVHASQAHCVQIEIDYGSCIENNTVLKTMS